MSEGGMHTSSQAWVDPRSNPEPPSVPRALATTGAEVEDLLTLCQTGRIYAVEQWVADGRPIQAEQHTLRGRPFAGSPALVAIQTGQDDLLRLLLCSGYQVARDHAQVLDHALRARQWDVVDLLLQWGADACAVEPGAVLGTYRADLIDRFWMAGTDFLTHDHLAYSLAMTSSNRPLYGWVRQHQDAPGIQRALAIALVQAVSDGRDRAVYLTRWAGADPHLKVPLLESHQPERSDEDEDRYSAVEMAVGSGAGRFLGALAPDPALDDFDALWSQVEDPDAVDRLFAIQQPDDWSPAILRNLTLITYWLGPDGADRSRRALLRIAFHDGRLTTADPRRIAQLRQDIIRLSPWEIRKWMLWWLGDARRCDEGIYKELVRTPRMREVLAELRR